ncbi:ABC transporter substrate-binding protein [Paenibacillus whitsoniae]|uniref:Carbohydrate ABC transporter substrate-binding protein n=1 Tax=Paenibacillus whitsoniae TaxID=2496558 RepID=A0A3S0CQW8_9BACL|nr:ABC transporter substrate-binding protein [Paenibacillus whitsoniae]RTE04307.1 carbohydrate ABC transporter substrate-binding protein [Paenibacillus whitsoniae]
MKGTFALRGVAVLTMTMLLTASCSPMDSSRNENEPDRVTTLTLMANMDWIGKPYIKRAWQLYEQAKGNKLDIQAAPIDTATTVIRKRVAMGEISDIVMYFGGVGLNDLHPEKNFVDMTGEQWVKDIKRSILPQLLYNGKIYGLPLWESSVSGILYNEELFDKLQIRKPTSRTQFDAACERLIAQGITPIYLAAKDLWPLFPQYGLDQLVKAYPHLVEDLNANRIKFADIPEFRELIDDYKNMALKGYFGTNYLNNNWDGQASALANGKYAMAFGWDVYLYSDVEPHFPGTAQKFGILPFFFGNSGFFGYEGPNVAMMMVNKNGRHVQESMEMIRYLAQTENLNEAFSDVSSETTFNIVNSNHPTHPYATDQDYIDANTNASITPFIIGYDQVEMGRILLRVLAGELTSVQAIKAMDDIRIAAAKAQQLPGF